MNEANSNQPLSEAQKDLVLLLWHCTARLCRMENGITTNFASGLFYRRDKRLFLLSVFHAFEKSDGWFVEAPPMQNGRQIHLALGRPNWVVRARGTDPDGTMEMDSDGLAWFEIDLDAIAAKLRSDGISKDDAPGLPNYLGELDVAPSASEEFAFAAAPGRTFFRDTPGMPTVEFERIYEVGMRYRGTDHRGFYGFDLAGKHKGHAHYAGSSGAPVADRQERIVGLLTSGNLEQNTVFAAPLFLFDKALSVPDPIPGSTLLVK